MMKSFHRGFRNDVDAGRAMLIVENLITEDRGASGCLVLIVIVRQTGFCFRPIITDKYYTVGINGLRLIPPVMLMN